MIDALQTSQLLLSLSLALAALKKDFQLATLFMILLFLVLYWV